jgi:hypothetical protein
MSTWDIRGDGPLGSYSESVPLVDISEAFYAGVPKALENEMQGKNCHISCLACDLLSTAVSDDNKDLYDAIMKLSPGA